MIEFMHAVSWEFVALALVVIGGVVIIVTAHANARWAQVKSQMDHDEAMTRLRGVKLIEQ